MRTSQVKTIETFLLIRIREAPGRTQVEAWPVGTSEVRVFALTAAAARLMLLAAQQSHEGLETALDEIRELAMTFRRTQT